MSPDPEQRRVEPFVQFDRRAGQFRDSDAVLEKYGVSPASIPDWLALVGDSADGFPGLPGWGAKTAAAVLRRYGHLEQIPHAPGQCRRTEARPRRAAADPQGLGVEDSRECAEADSAPSERLWPAPRVVPPFHRLDL